MAVVKSKRKRQDENGECGEGKLAVLTSAGVLMEHTIRITCNENSFPKRYRRSVTQQIVRDAVNINSYVQQANAIYVQSEQDYALRREFQTRALALTYSLLSEIDIAYRVFGIESDRVKFWTGLVDDAQKLIRSWQRAEKQRHDDAKENTGEDKG